MTQGPTDPFAPSRPGLPDSSSTPPLPPLGASPAATPGGPVGSPFGGGPAPLPTSAVAPLTVKRRSSAALLVNVLLGVALVVAVGGVAFAAGRATAPASSGTGRTNFGNGGNGGNGPVFGEPGFEPNASGAPGRGTFGAGGGAVSLQGTVTAVSADSITLQLASGQTITIPIDAQTTYHSRSAATAADVKAGSTVQVQLNGGRFGNGGQGGGGAAASAAPGGATPGSASSVTLVPAGS